MPVFQLDNELWFPPVEMSEADGLLAVDGDLSPERLLLAYQSGIFPWFSADEPILWWSPDPRFVLYPQNLRVSDTMKSILKKETFKVTFNTIFQEVMIKCGEVKRKGQEGTWITSEMVTAYTKLHEMGYAHSIEVWQENKLVGGLYGVKLGNAFFGESMFSKVSNASKVGFITFVRQQTNLDLKIIDCQVYTSHLESLGAQMIPRSKFLQFIRT